MGGLFLKECSYINNIKGRTYSPLRRTFNKFNKYSPNNKIPRDRRALVMFVGKEREDSYEYRKIYPKIT